MTKRKKEKNSQPAANARQERPFLEQNSENAENSPVAAAEAESTEVSTDEANAPQEPSGTVEFSEVAENSPVDSDSEPNSVETIPEDCKKKVEDSEPDVIPESESNERTNDREDSELRENQCPRCHKVSSEKAVHLGMNRVYPNIERHRIICEHCKQIHFIKKITPQ